MDIPNIFLSSNLTHLSSTNRPDYRETAVYGRKWMNRFLLQFASMKSIIQPPRDTDTNSNRFAAGQKLVMDETQRLVTTFLEIEKAASEYRHTAEDEVLYKQFVDLVFKLISGYNNMGTEHLVQMSWINPILLSSCIQSKNEDIRLLVQKLVQRTTPSPPTAPYPTPHALAKETAEHPGTTLDMFKSVKAPVPPPKAKDGAQNVIDAVLSLGPTSIKPPVESEEANAAGGEGGL